MNCPRLIGDSIHWEKESSNDGPGALLAHQARATGARTVPASPARLHGGDKKSEKEIDQLERNLGIPGAAWSLSGALETVLAEWHHQKNAADMMLAVLRRDGPAESA